MYFDEFNDEISNIRPDTHIWGVFCYISLLVLCVVYAFSLCNIT